MGPKIQNNILGIQWDRDDHDEDSVCNHDDFVTDYSQYEFMNIVHRV